MKLATNIVGALLGLVFVAGGLLVVPKTRNLGLLIIGPIIVNILCLHGFVLKGTGLFSPTIMLIALAALFLLWAERRAFAGLVKR